METTESLVRKPAKRERHRKSSREFLLYLIASGFFTGRLPLAPGTWGSLLAVLVVGGLAFLRPSLLFPVQVVLFWLAVLAALLSAGAVARREGASDPSVVVIDEIAGQWLCLLFVPPTALGLGAGFVLFRLLDLWKPFPARQSEQLPGAAGILLDDLIAGLYAGLLILLVVKYAG